MVSGGERLEEARMEENGIELQNLEKTREETSQKNMEIVIHFSKTQKKKTTKKALILCGTE